MATSLLRQLRSLLPVDVDSMDIHVSQRNTTVDEKFQDMTSNQALAYNEIIRPENGDLIKQAISSVQNKNLDQDPDTFKMDVIDTLVRRFHLTILVGMD
jgi:transaldolase